MRIDNNLNSSYINLIKTNNRVQNSQNPKSLNSNDVISKEEKQLFAELFPEKKNEVMSYNFYNRSGKITTAQIGSLIDRRF
ncbi:MAG: hypothetical protein NZM09_00340 [Ignavibacterium sp.]|nr:hypothetical protein [Ignavibacterium sp.]MDW8374118.1 hypothetical protein [Ignavibacteriales bacterium]